MATLQELRSLFGNSDLTEKVEAALIISANDLLAGTPTTAEQKWAALAFETTREEAQKAMKAVLASNSSATVTQILGATDTQIKTNVDAVVPTLVVAATA